MPPSSADPDPRPIIPSIPAPSPLSPPPLLLLFLSGEKISPEAEEEVEEEEAGKPPPTPSIKEVDDEELPIPALLIPNTPPPRGECGGDTGVMVLVEG